MSETWMEPKALSCDHCGAPAKITGPGQYLFTGEAVEPDDVGVVRHVDGLRQCHPYGSGICTINGATRYPKVNDKAAQ